MTVGILGMAFKADVDDERSSLSYKLRRILLFNSKEVLCSDPFVNDSRLISVEELVAKSDLIVVGTPHSEYRSLKFEQPVIDIWNLHGEGVLL